MEGRGRVNGFWGVGVWWEWFQSLEADCMGLNSLEDPERVRKRGVGSIWAACLEEKVVHPGNKRQEGQAGVKEDTI